MCRCNLKVTEPNVELYFLLNGYKCNLHFWDAQNEFPFFCIPVSTFSSNVQELNNTSLISSQFIRRFARTWKYPFTVTEFILFPLHSQTSPLGFEKEQLCIVPIRIFSFAQRYANFPYNVFHRQNLKIYFRSPLSPPKQTNKQ